MVKKFSKRIIAIALALACSVAMIPMTAVADNVWDYDGGGFIAWDDLDVYEDYTWSDWKGLIYEGEGFTILHLQSPEYETNPWMEVEYSTSTGPKQGFVPAPYAGWTKPTGSCVARPTSTCTIYAGPSSTLYASIGSVYSTERVAVLAKNGDWVYVEYNTTSGRKRGYMLYDDLFCYMRPDVFEDLPTWAGMEREMYVNGYKTVYSGPTSQYVPIGSVQDELVVVYYHREQNLYGIDFGATYIEYQVTGTGQSKTGFILD